MGISMLRYLEGTCHGISMNVVTSELLDTYLGITCYIAHEGVFHVHDHAHNYMPIHEV